MREPNILVRLGLALLGLTVALLLGECTARVGGLAPEMVALSEGRYRLSPNPAIGYEPIPGFAFESAEAGVRGEVPTDVADGVLHTEQWRDMWDINQAAYDYRGKANRMGYRDRDHDIAKPAGVYRVVVLGDSIAAGLYISRYENTFPALLEVRLRELGLDAEVINLSVNGYNTQQEVETLKDRGLQFSPDLVLLAYCVNDRQMSGNNVLLRLLAKKQEQDRLSEVMGSWLVRNSHLFRLFWYRLLPDAGPALPPAYESLRQDTVEKYLAELGRLQEEHRFQTLIASFPLLLNLDQPYGPRWESERLAIIRLSEQYGLNHLDLLPPFRACELESDEKISFEGLHPNATGHRCAAEAVAEHIAQSLPRSRTASVDR